MFANGIPGASSFHSNWVGSGCPEAHSSGCKKDALKPHSVTAPRVTVVTSFPPRSKPTVFGAAPVGNAGPSWAAVEISQSWTPCAVADAISAPSRVKASGAAPASSGLSGCSS